MHICPSLGSDTPPPSPPNGSKTSGNDISLPPARLERSVAWPGCGKCGRWCAGKGHRLWWCLRHPILRPAVAHKSCSCFWGQRGEQAASPLAYVRCRWISLTRTWTSRMSLTTLCGLCFAISCGAGHSTSWWPDHPHPLSQLSTGTHSTFLGSRSPVRGSTACTRPKSSGYEWPTCWRSEPQRRAALLSFCSRYSAWFFVLVCLGNLCRNFAPVGGRRTDFRLPSVGADRLPFGQALYWKADLSTTEAQFDDPSSLQSAPESGSQVVRNRPLCRLGSGVALSLESWKGSRPLVSSHRVTTSSSQGTHLLSTRFSQDRRTMLRLRKSPKSSTRGPGGHGPLPVLRHPGRTQELLGCGPRCLLSSPSSNRMEVRNTGSSGTFYGPMSTPLCPSLTERIVMPRLEDAVEDGKHVLRVPGAFRGRGPCLPTTYRSVHLSGSSCAERSVLGSSSSESSALVLTQPLGPVRGCHGIVDLQTSRSSVARSTWTTPLG